MSSGERELWEGIVDREALGEALTPDEAARRDVLGRTDTACAAETDVYRALGAALGKTSQRAAADDRLIRTALLAAADETKAPAAPSPRRAYLGVGLAAAAALVVGGVAAVATRTPPATSDASAPKRVEQPAKSAPAPATERRARLEGVEGSVLIDGATPRSGDGVALGARVQIGTGRACLAFERDVVACLGAGSEARVTALGEQQELALAKGHLVAVLKSQPSGSHFAVSTGSGVITAVGTVFAVEIGKAGGTTLRVAEGAVAARMKGRERLVQPGEALLLGAADATKVRSSDQERDRALVERVPSFAPALRERAQFVFVEASPGSSAAEAPRAERSPAALLELASKARSRGAYAEAASHYERLIGSHADTPEGRAALIGLAELRLSRLGEPARALALFERYLASGGSLAQEAHYGKIQALRALGRSRDAEGEVASFLERYPKSAYAGSLRKQK